MCVHLNEYEKRIYLQNVCFLLLLYMCKKLQLQKEVLSDLFFCIFISYRNRQGISYFNKHCTIVFLDKHYIFRKLERDFGSSGQNLKRMRHGNIFHAFWKIDQVPSATLCKTKALQCSTEDLQFSSSEVCNQPHVGSSYASGLLLTICCLNGNCE